MQFIEVVVFAYITEVVIFKYILVPNANTTRPVPRCVSSEQNNQLRQLH